MKPYYEHGGITIYHGDCRVLLGHFESLLAILGAKIGLIATDPPYGISYPTNYASRGRGTLANCSDYPPVMSDDEQFEPKTLLDMRVPMVLWGANWYASRLPDSGGWLVWDKERPDGLDQATCELAWSNFVKGVRRFRYLWNGMIRAGDEELFHPCRNQWPL